MTLKLTDDLSEEIAESCRALARKFAPPNRQALKALNQEISERMPLDLARALMGETDVVRKIGGCNGAWD